MDYTEAGLMKKTKKDLVEIIMNSDAFNVQDDYQEAIDNLTSEKAAKEQELDTAIKNLDYTKKCFDKLQQESDRNKTITRVCIAVAAVAIVVALVF